MKQVALATCIIIHFVNSVDVNASVFAFVCVSIFLCLTFVCETRSIHLLTLFAHKYNFKAIHTKRHVQCTQIVHIYKER